MGATCRFHSNLFSELQEIEVTPKDMIDFIFSETNVLDYETFSRKLEEYKESAFLSKKLATIVTDVEMDLKQVTEHVYYVQGKAGIATDNEGFISNAGFIVTDGEGAHGIDIGSSGERLELGLGLVEIEELLDAVEVLSDVVLVLHDSKSSLNLIFVHFY